jgi:uncharacterized protein (TIGR00369 family)
MIPVSDSSEHKGDFDRLVQEIAAPPFHDLLRPEAVSVDPVDRSVVVRLTFRSDLCGSRQQPFFHGGVIASLIDLTGHAAIAIQVGHSVPTIDLRVDYLRAASNEDLLATGRALSIGSSIARADVEIRTVQGRLIALGRGAFSTLKR